MPGTTIEDVGILGGWAAAADELLLPGASPAFLAVTVGTGFAGAEPEVRSIDALAHARGAERPSAVAAMLMPPRVLTAAGPTAAKIDAGLNLFGRARARGLRFSGWRNTYFERIVGRWRDRHLVLHEIKENRLASIISRISAWGMDVQAALYAHTDAPSDHLRIRGAPCLQYVQFRLYGHDKLELFALYRAHDYLNKALGNFIGLQRLGQFVAQESGRHYERQTVFSLHPFIDAGRTTHLRLLLADVRDQPGV